MGSSSCRRFEEIAVLVRDTVDPATVPGTPYVALEHISEGGLRLIGTGLAEDSTSTKSRFRSGDILFGKLRPYFRKVVRPRFDGICSTDIWVVRPGPGVDAGYLFYLMASASFVEPVVRASEGTKMPRAKWEYASRLRFELPPIDEQRRIARVLGALDDKIELNRKMSQTLDKTAEAIFKSTFVDFGGRVRDGQTGFPAGWLRGRLSDLAAHPKEPLDPRPSPTVKFDHFSIPAFDESRLPHRQFGAEIKSTKTRVPEGSVLLSKLNPQFPRVWWPVTSPGTPAIASTEFIVLVPKPPVTRAYLYGLVSSAAFSEELATYVTGTSGSHQRVRPDTALGISVLIPSIDAIVDFTLAAEPLLERSSLCLRESATLAALRDALLPRLLSGELSIPDSEQVTEEVV